MLFLILINVVIILLRNPYDILIIGISHAYIEFHLQYLVHNGFRSVHSESYKK